MRGCDHYRVFVRWLLLASGACAAGFFCPINSTRNTQFGCSRDLSNCPPNATAPEVEVCSRPLLGEDARRVYCPEGSWQPLLVGPGNYSKSTTGNTISEASLQVCTPRTVPLLSFSGLVHPPICVSSTVVWVCGWWCILRILIAMRLSLLACVVVCFFLELSCPAIWASTVLTAPCSIVLRVVTATPLASHRACAAVFVRMGVSARR